MTAYTSTKNTLPEGPNYAEGDTLTLANGSTWVYTECNGWNYTGPFPSVTATAINATTLAVSGRAALTGDVALAAGAGTAGTGTICKTSVTKEGGLFITRILVDLTGLNSGGTAGDIIGKDATAAAYLTQITAAVNGTILGGRVLCLEAPAGGDNDIDLYAATEATGAEDAAISGLTATQAVNGGVQALGTVSAVIADSIGANKYLYLVGQGGGNAAFTAGRLLIELFGV